MIYVDSDGVLADFTSWIKSKDPTACLDDDKKIYSLIVDHCDGYYSDFSTLPGAEFMFENIINRDKSTETRL